jgi:hypothetical protein
MAEAVNGKHRRFVKLPEGRPKPRLIPNAIGALAPQLSEKGVLRRLGIEEGLKGAPKALPEAIPKLRRRRSGEGHHENFVDA